MATARDRTYRIQVQHILIALVGTASAILFTASIVLITIGYQNPFGSVGLGILGGGCVVFFSAVLFLCACSIWIKNKYYGDETDYKEKLVGRSSEDITLLKPASYTVSPEHPEKEHEKDEKNNSVPMYSVSTFYSSVSSSSDIIPEKLMSNIQQEEDMAGDLDSDVFSSSLTALQHSGMKLQQRMTPIKSSSDLLIGGKTGHNTWDVKDEQKKQPANKVADNNKNCVSDLPRQRKPLVMDSLSYMPPGNRDTHVELPMVDVKSAKAKAHSSTNKGLCDTNTQPFPVDTSKITVAAFQPNDCKSNYEKEQAPDQRNWTYGKQNMPTADKQGLATIESDLVIPNTTRTNKQDIMRKDLISVLQGNLEKKSNTNKETGKSNQDRTAKALQGISSKSKPDQLANFHIPSHVTRAEASSKGRKT